ncbi:HNH endonuclease signature motif containing protein [Corynebacterium caspium]|uniref:HNH endonuclease signature motif containing protein n=1 Tax=Corynebacterium caspium TaxID=234828 RepID=UPI000379248F|nr:HNH endonuclease signature motif containing protein [Corynebacterium caspium]WKD59890.1 hypothetical protein CCASP_07575 [Corynebacterium caspium DSM 44850]
MDNLSSLSDALTAINAGLKAFTDVFNSPTAEAFNQHIDEIIQLEETLNAKDHLDIAIAYAADLADAGRLVGSSRTSDFLAKKLKISKSEALQRLNLSKQLYSPPDVAKEIKAKEERIKQENREKYRRKRISKEKLSIIAKELSNLNQNAETSPDELFSQAVDLASNTSPEELRAATREFVNTQNRKFKDPLAALRKRKLWISSDPDADGGFRFGGYLPAGPAALLKNLIAPAVRPQIDSSINSDSEDGRTLDQRRADALIALLNNAGNLKTHRQHGTASLVISVSPKDLMEGPADALGKTYPSNTGVKLSAIDILGLGLSKFDFGVLHDSNGQPLALGRSKRSASLAQRIALFASQLVCAAPHCTKPACETDAHHLVSWIRKGRTDIENLVLLCRRHHSDNRDQRDGKNNMGYFDRCPKTKRVGLKKPAYKDGTLPALEFNDSTIAKVSAGHRIRAQKWGWQCDTDPSEGEDYSPLMSLNLEN